MDRLDAMSTLLRVVDTGSLSAAGRSLGMPLATVSRKISDLEAHLNVRLLIRSPRSLRLTEAGQAYVASCRRILEEVGEAERLASGEYRAPRGDLTIAAPVVFGRLHVLPIVSGFLLTHEDINVRLVLADGMANLLEDHIDLAFRIGDLPDSSLVAMRLGMVRRVTCASPAYLERFGEPHMPEEMSRHACVTFAGLASSTSWTFMRGKAPVTVPVHSRIVVNTAEAAVDAAVSGLGLAKVLSYQAAAARQSGALKFVLESYEQAAWPVHLVHTGQAMPLKLRAFIDYATPRLKDILAP